MADGLAGRGAITIWQDVRPEAREDFFAWHNGEHIPERVGIPGFLRGRRYGALAGSPEFFTLYGHLRRSSFDHLQVGHVVPAAASPVRTARGSDSVQALAHRPVAQRVEVHLEAEPVQLGDVLGQRDRQRPVRGERPALPRLLHQLHVARLQGHGT